MAISIPLGLKTALEAGECVLFVGAGIGEHLTTPSGTAAPNAKALAAELNEHFKLGLESSDLAKVARVVEMRKSRTDLDAYLKKRLGSVEPDGTFRWIASVRWRAIFTTNYDNGIERSYALASKPPQTCLSISATSDLCEYDVRFEVPIYHIHGKLDDERGGPVVITGEDYARFSQRRSMLFDALKLKGATSPFLYIGYGNQDTDWISLYTELKREFAPSVLPRSYRVDPFTDEIDKEIFRSEGLESILTPFSTFVDAANADLQLDEMDEGRLERIRNSVPSHMRGVFEQNPASVARLLTSWEYVNQSAFDEPSNIQAFLKGDRPTWATIANQDYFARDLDPHLLDLLLDFATAGLQRPQSALLLASAGFGTTTLLKAAAVSYIKEKAGPVFYHRQGAPLLEGDIEFASAIFPGQAPVFVVDDASDYTKEIKDSIGVLRDLGRESFLLLGARRNEWMQSHARMPGKGFDVESLSDDEIERLLVYLRKNGALNKLEALSPEMQTAAIRQRDGKDLLVVMREATEDRSFDAIIEDEFLGIGSEAARRMYLAVCCVSQHGGLVRDAALAKVLNIDLADMYRGLGGTEGVVIFEEIDGANGVYAARARHRTIAAIVWERCGDPVAKSDISQLTLNSLNLNFGTDVRAFEQMIRSDRLIDGLRTLEDKIRFFDMACKKDPTSPYVRQHYARMFLRSGKPELALSQVDMGIGISDDRAPRVLYHTKGLVLSKLAHETESIEIARKRLAQAESAFRKLLSINRRDAYAYQGLAQLFLDWAKRAQDEEERATYLAKCEEIIDLGLREVREKDGLWIVSADVELFVGNDPKHLAALEKAVREVPESVVGRYLLARKYRSDGRYEEALGVLEPVIEKYPDEFRSYQEYALTLVGLGRPRVQAINLLRQSSLYGMADTRYLAILGGLLYLDRQFGEAEKVFGEGIRRELPASDLQVVRFRPGVRLTGLVEQMMPGFCLIGVNGFPRIFCPASKFRGTQLRRGLQIEFELVFNARSAIAENLVMA